MIETVQSAQGNCLNGPHRLRHLLSVLLESGVCGGPPAMRGQDRYGRLNDAIDGTCPDGRGIDRAVIEERVPAGLKVTVGIPARRCTSWGRECRNIWRRVEVPA